jgi:hypothetical protein
LGNEQINIDPLGPFIIVSLDMYFHGLGEHKKNLRGTPMRRYVGRKQADLQGSLPKVCPYTYIRHILFISSKSKFIIKNSSKRSVFEDN